MWHIRHKIINWIGQGNQTETGQGVDQNWGDWVILIVIYGNLRLKKRQKLIRVAWSSEKGQKSV